MRKKSELKSHPIRTGILYGLFVGMLWVVTVHLIFLETQEGSSARKFLGTIHEPLISFSIQTIKKLEEQGVTFVFIDGIPQIIFGVLVIILFFSITGGVVGLIYRISRRRKRDGEDAFSEETPETKEGSKQRKTKNGFLSKLRGKKKYLIIPLVLLMGVYYIYRLNDYHPKNSLTAVHYAEAICDGDGGEISPDGKNYFESYIDLFSHPSPEIKNDAAFQLFTDQRIEGKKYFNLSDAFISEGYYKDLENAVYQGWQKEADPDRKKWIGISYCDLVGRKYLHDHPELLKQFKLDLRFEEDHEEYKIREKELHRLLIKEKDNRYSEVSKSLAS